MTGVVKDFWDVHLCKTSDVKQVQILHYYCVKQNCKKMCKNVKYLWFIPDVKAV